ncbi:MAG: hypothetical protein IKW84_08940 [Bacteroidaceae bacterium]|nr:hypothetical protein [Bacteroidaceae bacterium]
MPSTGSQQTMELQNELEERRKREEQERLAAQAAELAAAQKQQAAALQGQVQPGISAAQMAAGTQPAATTHDTDNGEDVEGVEVNRTVSTVMEQANRDMEQAAEDAAKANAAANANYQNFLGKIVEGYQNELREAKKEAELQRQIDTTKSVFAGVTEFASALTNLIGTSRGAVNQQPRTVTQDWMREVDQHRLQERERLDRMRDKLRQQEMAGENARHQFTKEQIVEQLNLRKLKGANAMGLAQQRKAEDDEAYERGRNTVSDVLAAKRIEAQMRGQDVEMAAIKQRYSADETRFNIELLKQGLVPDGNGGFSYDPATAAKKMGAQALEIPAYGDRNAVVMYVHPNSLKNTILSYAQDKQVKEELAAAGFDLDAIVNQLKGAKGDMFTEGKLSGTDLQTQIQTAAMYSPTLVEALRRVSINSYNIGEQQQQGPQKNEIKTDKDGFPVAG